VPAQDNDRDLNVLIDKMTQLDKSSRYAVYAALLVISSVAMYGQIVSPHVQYLKAVQHYEPTIDQMIDKQVDISHKLVGRREMLEDLQTQFDTISFTVFNPEKVKEFSGGLEQLAEEFRCSIAKMDSSADKGQVVVGEVSDPSYIESVEMSLAVLGEYSQLTLFIDALQHQERQVWLTSVDVTMMKDQTRVLQCDITIKLYVLKQRESETVL
jgi:Tfp pilus assembly protein PilO